MIVHRFGSVASISLYTITLFYIRDLEKNKCNCAKGWKMDFIKYHSWFRIVMSVLSLHPNIDMTRLHLIQNISVYLTAASILEIYAHLTWVKNMENSCDCADNWKQKLMEK